MENEMGAITRLLVASAMLFATAIQLQASEADLAKPAVVEAFVDGFAKPMMRDKGSPSATVAIAHQDEVIFAKGYGYKNLEERIPIQVDKTLFRVGSISKLFAWVSAMQLVEQGKLDLDEDVNSYLKAFQIDDTWPGHPVTLRHLMTHTAGFEDGSLGYALTYDPSRILPLAEAMKNYQPYRINPPGRQVSYSNYGAALAGLIVANVSGVEFNEYVKKNIFDILGMESASFDQPLPEYLNDNMAGTYLAGGGDFGAMPYEIVATISPAGSMAATATDMLKFGLAILNAGVYNGKRILKEETVDQMLNQQFSQDKRIPGLGFGFWRTSANGNLLVGHEGDTYSFHSDLIIDRANKLVYFVSFSGAGGFGVRTAFKSAFYNQFFPSSESLPKLKAPTDFSERSEKYVGVYKLWRSNFSTIEKATTIKGPSTVISGPDNTLIISTPLGSQKYAEVGNNLFKVAEPLMPGPSMVAFQEDESGDIVGMVSDIFPHLSIYKSPWYNNSAFNYTILTLSLLIFGAVWLRFWWQRAAYKVSPVVDKAARRSALMVSGANLAAVLSGYWLMDTMLWQLFEKISIVFELWLVLPIIAVVAGLYQIIRTLQVWRDNLLGGVWERISFSLVTIAGCFMCWFYWYWNILGFNYYSL